MLWIRAPLLSLSSTHYFISLRKHIQTKANMLQEEAVICTLLTNKNIKTCIKYVLRSCSDDAVHRLLSLVSQGWGDAGVTFTLGSDLGSKKCLVGSNTPITTLTKELHVLQTAGFTPETLQHLQRSISTLDWSRLEEMLRLCKLKLLHLFQPAEPQWDEPLMKFHFTLFL